MGECVTVEMWCPFVKTQQDFPDVCLVGGGVFESAAKGEEDESDYRYYSWYKITCSSKRDGKTHSVYRRIRTVGFDGYPNGCLVVDPFTADELGLSYSKRGNESREDWNKDHTHFRNTQIAISEKKKGKNDCKALHEFIKAEGGSIQYQITTVPIYRGDSITLTKVRKWNPRALVGRTLRHPDYALRVASYIAMFSLVLSLIALVVSVAK